MRGTHLVDWAVESKSPGGKMPGYSVANRQVTFNFTVDLERMRQRVAVAVVAEESIMPASSFLPFLHRKGPVWTLPASHNKMSPELSEANNNQALYSGNWLSYDYSKNAQLAVEGIGRQFPTREILKLVQSDEIRIPQFGSPPKSWQTLSEVAARCQHAVLTWPGVEASRGHYEIAGVLALAYMGGQAYVRVIVPVLDAFGDGLSAIVKRRFGLPAYRENDRDPDFGYRPQLRTRFELPSPANSETDDDEEEADDDIDESEERDEA
jgi:hypothetical protein